MKIVKVRRVGNSNVVSIPREFEARGYAPGTSVLVEELDGGELRILPTEQLRERIRTIGELAGCERRWLVQHFGPNHGTWMHESAWGRDDRPVVTQSEPVSMSRETTFDRDLHAVRDRDELRALFTDLCQRLALDLQRHGYVGKTIGIKLRYDNFQRATREQTIEVYTSDAAMIRRAAGQCEQQD